MKIGKRGYSLERYINTKYGISTKDDTLPKRLTDTPQIKGNESTKVPLKRMQKTYYKARGWDEFGIPTKKTINKLKILE